MKSIILLFSCIFSLECFSCRGNDFDDCVARGSYLECQPNEEVCQVSLRKRNGVIEKVNM